jgi:peptide deformylase
VTNPRSPAVRVVVDDLKETLRDLKSRYGIGRGIAAPQIGAPMRVIYVELDRPWVLINPEIVDVGTEDFAVWDDCFSFINLMVRVQRAYRIKVRYQDLRGKTHTVELEGDVAELLQHEIDHLEGVLALDRPAGLDSFCMREEWNKHHALTGRYGEPSLRAEPVAI